VIWAFLSIFIVTAIIALGSLPGWIPLQPYYKKKLFTALIVQVVGCVCGFGVWALQAIRRPKTDLKTTLLSAKFGWDWQYAPDRMRARIYFDSVKDDKIRMRGHTDIVDENNKRLQIINWQSSEPFDVPPDAETVTFKAWREYTADAAKADPTLLNEVGKKTNVTITLHSVLAFEGASVDDLPQPGKPVSQPQPWGIFITPAYP
jgi:hypothetical protein